MKIQSLSILVPTKDCVNNCKFCVSRMRPEENFDTNKNRINFYKRMKFARDNNCNTVVLTGTGEPFQNQDFLEHFFEVNNSLPNPFDWIEFQTSGVMLNDENLQFLKKNGVVTISLSLSYVFDSKINADFCGISKKLYFDIYELCEKIKYYGFNLRLSLNMSKVYTKHSISSIFDKAKELGADQATIRKLYASGEGGEVDNWIKENSANKLVKSINADIIKNGEVLGILPFGAKKYSYKEMSVVVDEDCMAEAVKDAYKYLILKNGKLYSKWDDDASLIF